MSSGSDTPPGNQEHLPEDGPQDELAGFADLVARDLAAVGAASLSALPQDFDEESWDDGEPDPGCVHPWYRLDFVADEPGLGCSRCGRAWLLEDPEDAQDALLVVWQASRHEFENMRGQLDSLATVVEKLSGLRHCRSCGAWRAPDVLALFGPHAACVHHVGAVLAADEDPSVLFPAAAAWLVDNGYIASSSPSSQWVVEANILEFPPLGEAFGRLDDDLPRVAIRLHSSVSGKLGVRQDTTVGEVSDSVASLLALDTPSTRPAWAFLLGIVAEANDAAQSGRTPSLRDALTRATPIEGTHRAIIVMDLCRSDMPEDGTFTGDMADDLVRSVGTRAFELFHNASD